MFPYVRLCLNGGGIRGIMQLGALKYIENMHKKPLYQVFPKGIHGVSIGAIISSFLAFGYTIDEIIKTMDSFMSIRSALAPIRLDALMRIPTQKGLDDGEQLKETLTKAFENKGLKLNKLRIGDALCPLRIYASDITHLKPVAFSENILLWDALRASTAIPFVYTPHAIKGRLFIDGGIMVNNLMTELHESQRKTSLHVYCSRPIGVTDPTLLTFSDYAAYIMNTRQTLEHIDWKKKYPRSFCIIENNTVQMLDFEKAKKNKELLLSLGNTTMESFFQNQELESRNVSSR